VEARSRLQEVSSFFGCRTHKCTFFYEKNKTKWKYIHQEGRGMALCGVGEKSNFFKIHQLGAQTHLFEPNLRKKKKKTRRTRQGNTSHRNTGMPSQCPSAREVAFVLEESNFGLVLWWRELNAPARCAGWFQRKNVSPPEGGACSK
jgi:hypothetical protein